MEPVVVIGGGLAGSEAAYKLAQKGIKVKLFEMRPRVTTPAHRTGYLAELICSNSLKSESLDTAQGLLKAEMRKMGSLILDCAEKCRVAAGSALAVDRDMLGAMVTEIIEGHPLIEVVREEVAEIPKDGIVIVASGPLTAGALAETIQGLTGAEYLHFYDAVAPIVTADSVDMNRAFRGSRYGKGSDDYINCPMTDEEYAKFCEELIKADPVPLNEADRDLYFNACMPIEEIARRGPDTLKYGPMRPVGLPDPVTGKIPAAVVQLRNENQDGSMLGLVGFQTRMKWGDQERVLRLIPALENAVFLRLGVMHRNTFINSPNLLDSNLEFRNRPGLFFAGQLTGVEGYMESAASGIWVGMNCARVARGMNKLTLPEETMLGSLFRYVSDSETRSFQPMNANFGLLPSPENRIRNKKLRNTALSERSLDILNKLSEEFSD
ncbi:MAG: FADH(2)-oxidizing methylenetetrahydrofolate--tRNA-(uracil(54)-C(5))-methyltransferase TrmFO [Candidatus Saccharibacteria bacterium]